MQFVKRIVAAALALFILGATTPSDVSVPQSEIQAENAHWAALGVHLPPGGVVLQHPYSAPYSNRSFVVPFSWYAPYYRALKSHRPYPINARALRNDLPVLRLLIEKTYAGYQVASARGWNWDAWFRKWSADLTARGNAMLSVQQAFAPWDDYEAFQLDNHSGLPGMFQSGSRSAVLQSEPSQPCTVLVTNRGHSKLNLTDKGQQPHAVQAWNGTALRPAWYVSYPSRDGLAQDLQCGTRSIALTPAADVANFPQTPAYEVLANGIAYVRMPTFNDANDAALIAALSKAPGVGKERIAIFDLRGNEGGNAPASVLNRWFSQSEIESAESLRQIGTQSCFRTALFFNLQQQLVQGLKPPVNPGLTQELQSVVDVLRGPSNCDTTNVSGKASGGTLADHVFSPHPQRQGHPRIIALVDSGCGSDCEYITDILGRLPNTVIAGTSTYGVMGFTQPGYFVLPNSRVPFRLALSRTDAYGDGRSVDGYGITVDILLPTTQSQSRESLLALARALE